MLKTNSCRAWTQGDPILEAYHDYEWCRINHDDRFQFEMLCLEGASVGLSWKTIMHKRENYRKAFFNFDIKKCAVLTDEYLASQMENPGLIRNRGKIYSVRKNAQAVMRIQKEFGSFDKYLWSFTSGEQITGAWANLAEVPAVTELSRTISADMKKRGIVFAGPVITYSFLQSIGIVNDHLISCEFKRECE
ncbi:MAG: DNA-3-methyladenine glycosylase I [Oscillospiraceae bacterium]|nr:DNA-3-methyladenine glycosylase I [Oscillospiraceae bacterium]